MRRPGFYSVILATLISACAAPVKEQEQAGFISDYSRLEPTDQQAYAFFDDKISQYDTFMIDPVTQLFEQDPEKPKFTAEEIESLKQYFVDRLSEALSEGEDGYAVVSEAAPGVARIKLALTQLEDSVAALNFSYATKLTGAGLGGVAIELEIVDSVSGEQLAALVRWGSGSRVLPGGFKKTGHAETLLKRWTKQLRKELDSVRAGNPWNPSEESGQ